MPPQQQQQQQQQQQRPPSPRGGGKPYLSRGGTGRGRYNSEGRGRSSFRGGGGGGGGRERNDGRFERFSDHTSPDRIIHQQQSSNNSITSNNNDRNSGYESGECIDRPVSHRPSSSAGRSSGFEGGRGGGRSVIPRGGGRDGGRGRMGRGGRYFDRGGGRGGRSDYRGRGRSDGGDGRASYSNSGKEWTPTGGRSTAPEAPQRFMGGPGDSSSSRPLSDDAPGGYASMLRNEPLYTPRGEDRGNPQGRSFSGNNNPVNRGRYSSLGSDPDIPPSRNQDSRPDDRFGNKRRRDDQGFHSTDYDEKRTRNNEYVPRNRGPPPEDSRPFSSGGPPPHPQHSSNDGGPLPPLNDRIVETDRRGLGPPRGGHDGPPIVDNLGPTMNHDNRRGSFNNLHHSDPRSRMSTLNDEPRDLDPRVDKRPVLASHPNDEPRMGSTMHRDDPRGAFPSRGGGIGPPHQEDPRKAPPRFRDDTSSTGGLPQRHPPRHDFQKDSNQRDPRQTVDSRPRNMDDPRAEPGVVDDIYSGDVSPAQKRLRPPDSLPTINVDRGRDFQGSHHMGGGRKDDFRQGPDTSRNIPSDSGWASQAAQPPPQPYGTQPQPHNRNTWNSSESRSPRPSPSTFRRTILPPGTDHAPPFQDSGPVDTPGQFSDNRGLGSDNRSPFLDDRVSFGRGRGRGRGFRGRGRGRSDFGRFGGRSDFGRFGGRGSNDYGPDIQQSSYRSLEDNRNRWNDGVQDKEDAWPPPSSNALPDRAGPPHHHQHATQQTAPMKSNEIAESNKRQAQHSMQLEKEKDAPKAKPAPVVEEKPKEKPRPPSPPPPSEPSGVMQALARLIDLEAQMKYAYVKHMQLVNRQAELQAQSKLLATLPVAMEAFKEDLDALGS